MNVMSRTSCLIVVALVITRSEAAHESIKDRALRLLTCNFNCGRNGLSPEGRRKAIIDNWASCGDAVEQLKQVLNDSTKETMKGHEDARRWTRGDWDNFFGIAPKDQTVIVQVTIQNKHTFTIEKRFDGTSLRSYWVLVQGYDEQYHTFWWCGLGLEDDDRGLYCDSAVEADVEESRDTWGRGSNIYGCRGQLAQYMDILCSNPWGSTLSKKAWRHLPFLSGFDIMADKACSVGKGKTPKITTRSTTYFDGDLEQLRNQNGESERSVCLSIVRHAANRAGVFVDSRG